MKTLSERVDAAFQAFERFWEARMLPGFVSNGVMPDKSVKSAAAASFAEGLIVGYDLASERVNDLVDEIRGRLA